MNEMCEDPDPPKVAYPEPKKDPLWVYMLCLVTLGGVAALGVNAEKVLHIFGGH